MLTLLISWTIVQAAVSPWFLLLSVVGDVFITLIVAATVWSKWRDDSK